MAKSNPARKQRRTFTLSPESLAYLEKETRRRGADSQSSVLDEVLREKNLERDRAALEVNITAYYDSLTDEEVEEQRAWAQFAEQTLVSRRGGTCACPVHSAAKSGSRHCQPILRKKESVP